MRAFKVVLDDYSAIMLPRRRAVNYRYPVGSSHVAESPLGIYANATLEHARARVRRFHAGREETRIVEIAYDEVDLLHGPQSPRSKLPTNGVVQVRRCRVVGEVEPA